MKISPPLIILLLISFSNLLSQETNFLYLKIQDNKYGYVNMNDEFIIPPGKYEYCFTDTFKNFAIVFNSKGKLIAIDQNESVLFEVFNFDNGPDYPSEGLFRIVKNKKIGFADLSGNVIIEPQYDFAFPFSDNAAAVCLNCTIINDGEHQYIENGDWGFINKSGEIIVPLIYEGVLDSFVNGVAVVKKDGNDLRINKSGEIIKMESKDFTGWVELLADQMILTNKLYGNQSTGINILWDAVRESFVLDYYDHGILQITFSDKQRRLSLIHYTVIPWQNVREYKIGNELQDPIMMQNILTVTDYAIILYSEDAAVNNDEDKELVSRFHEAFKKVINFEENQNEVDELSIELPNTVQVISLKEYQNYINLEFAEPGSDMSFINEIGNLSDRKMIYLTITPEIGPVKRMWVKPDNPFIDTYYLSVEKNLLDLFKSAIHKSITDIDKRVEIFHGAIEKLRELFNAANSYVNLLFERYENRLSDWLFCSESQAINYPGDKNIFTDYQPKKTPDTIIDFMPQLSEEFEQLPSSDLNNLIPLINLFIKYEKLAETNPGEWYEGNIILGAKEREYLPSKEELILSEIGNRINQITQINNSFTIKQMIKSANISLDRLNYKEYTVIHYDVMGSGRFFYIEEIINKIVSF